MNLKKGSIQDYHSKLNRVIEYLVENIGQEINLDDLAKIAHLSAFHFHRIFTWFIGETPHQYMLRIRLEKTAYLIRHAPQLKIADIAYKYGFNTLSHFSSSFSRYFGISPTAYRDSPKPVFGKDGYYLDLNGCPHDKSISLKRVEAFDYNALIFKAVKIAIENLPDQNAVYIRHEGDFKSIGTAYKKLEAWAADREIKLEQVKRLTLIHDNPSITDLGKIRQYACLLISDNLAVSGEIGRCVIPGGRYVTGRFVIGETEFEKAWNTICLWLVENNYCQNTKNSFELYHGMKLIDGKMQFEVSMFVPVH